MSFNSHITHRPGRMLIALGALVAFLPVMAQEAADAALEAGGEVVVQVGDEELTAEEADALVQQRLKQLGGRIPPDQLQAVGPRIRDQIVQEFVVRAVLLE
jgi:hypothetical protein